MEDKQLKREEMQMNNEIIKDIAERMMIKIRVMYLYINEYKNKRECPFYSELIGMEQLLKTIGVEFEYTFDLDTMEITALTIGDITVKR